MNTTGREWWGIHTHKVNCTKLFKWRFSHSACIHLKWHRSKTIEIKSNKRQKKNVRIANSVHDVIRNSNGSTSIGDIYLSLLLSHSLPIIFALVYLMVAVSSLFSLFQRNAVPAYEMRQLSINCVRYCTFAYKIRYKFLNPLPLITNRYSFNIEKAIFFFISWIGLFSQLLILLWMYG